MKDVESQGHQRLPGSEPVMPIAWPEPAKDYLFLSMASFCFCVVLAFPALLFSLQTLEANYDGDWRRAQRNSRLALGFSVCSILVGCVVVACSVTLILETEFVASS